MNIHSGSEQDSKVQRSLCLQNGANFDSADVNSSHFLRILCVMMFNTFCAFKKGIFVH